MEEEHEPSLWVKKGFHHLLLLEFLVFDASLVGTYAINCDGLLSLSHELRADGIIGEEDSQ